MKKRLSASSLLVSFVIMIAILAIVFINKEHLLHRERLTQQVYSNYLNDKFDLMNEINKPKAILNQTCQTHQQETISIPYHRINYQFHCEKIGLFFNKPTKKYIQTSDIHQHLNRKIYQDLIYHIDRLEDLPDTSENNPKIVILTKAISDKLSKDFYGIIIASDEFNLRFGGQFYGVIYSSHPNKTNRYSTFNPKVIDYLDKQLSYWQYLPYSRTILNEKIN